MKQRVMVTLWRDEKADLPGYSGNVYDEQWVANLARNVKRQLPNGELVVVADTFYCRRLIEAGEQNLPELKEVQIVPMLGVGIGGWSNVFELWRPELWPEEGARHLAVGLDTVFVGDPSWLFRWDEGHVGVPFDPYHHPEVCDAVISFDKAGAAMLWNEFLHSKGDGMKQDHYMGRPSEMALIRRMHRERGAPWVAALELMPERLLSYKCHVKTGEVPVQSTTSVVYFHGTPKPHQLGTDDPIRKEWEAP